ncbi:MAG: tRNA epoxyqueuosine(34) reductase QueG [Armatimonadetes bacterium]|nr:tRNA epoxyqueuosine(34) reductase QueG [Armatimonadota bacterium]
MTRNTPDRLAADLKKTVLEIGFDAVGIAPPAPLDLAERAISERVKSGRLIDYGFSRKPAEYFTHPENLIPGARSIIVAALSYHVGECEDNSLFQNPISEARSVASDRVLSPSPRILSLSKDAATHSSCFDRLSMGSECVASVNPPTNDASRCIPLDGAGFEIRPHRGDKTPGPRGRVARFALGRDYHKVVEELLHELGEWLKDQVENAEYRICVDTGPMIDRAAAREAGVGSYGKNTAIITREAGSWVVLGEIITNVELQPDKPAPLEECGSCSACIAACPTGAIVSPFVIDQTRCVSHLTQMKGSIPQEMRPLMGDRIYGCDVCQEVCPKNNGLTKSAAMRDPNTNCLSNRQPAVPLLRASTSSACSGCGTAYSNQNWYNGGLDARPEILPLLNLSKEEFDRLVGPTAIAWIGRSRFRRNVAVALGNAGDPSAIPELTAAINDDDPIVREHAAWALELVSHLPRKQPLSP